MFFKTSKKEEADEEVLVFIRSNVYMLQKEKICYWSQYSSSPHILQGSSAQCIRHSCYPGRYSGWLANKVEKGHLKSFSSSGRYGHTLKENKSSYSTSPQHHPHISKHVFYTGKKGRILPLEIVQWIFSPAVSWGSLLGLRWGALPLHVQIGNSWLIFLLQFNFYQVIKDLHSVGVCRKGKREPGCAHSMQWLTYVGTHGTEGLGPKVQ